MVVQRLYFIRNDDPIKVASLFPIVGVTVSQLRLGARLLWCCQKPGTQQESSHPRHHRHPRVAFFAQELKLLKSYSDGILSCRPYHLISCRVLDIWTRTFDTELRVSKANNNLESGQLSIKQFVLACWELINSLLNFYQLNPSRAMNMQIFICLWGSILSVPIWHASDLSWWYSHSGSPGSLVLTCPDPDLSLAMGWFTFSLGRGLGKRLGGNGSQDYIEAIVNN